MNNIEEKEGYSIYTFNGIDLRIKSAENMDNAFVYINYKGYNPLMSMLFGDFSAECEIDSIEFTVQRENGADDCTMYAIVTKDKLTEFIKEIYFFVMENRNVLDRILSIKDKNNWSF